MTTGAEEMIANLRKLEVQNRAAARRAVTRAAELFAEDLQVNTPVDEGGLEEGVTITGFKGGNQGLLEKDIGYNRSVGFRVHFPDTGTIHQRPQNFVERTIKEVTPKVLEAYQEELQKGLKL